MNELVVQPDYLNISRTLTRRQKSLSYLRPTSPQQWQVYRVANCRYVTPVKDKFVVLACLDSNWYGFFINSRLGAFFQYNQRLLPCVVGIDSDEYGFLDHDSHICCNDIYRYESSELRNYQDTLSRAGIAAVRAAVQSCPSLSPHYKRLISPPTP